MTTLQGSLTPDGALVDVELGWGSAQAAKLRAARRPVPPPVALRAVLDTGAEVSCLDAAVVQALGLPLHNVTFANAPGVSGFTLALQRYASLVVLHPSQNAQFNLVVRDLIVVELPLNTVGCQALLGRDVLACCDFLFSGRSGTFTLTY